MMFGIHKVLFYNKSIVLRGVVANLEKKHIVIKHGVIWYAMFVFHFQLTFTISFVF